MKMGESTIAYLKARKSKLKSKDFIVSLLIDEIYTKKGTEYTHGKFFGGENGTLAKTLLCLMIKSVAGKYRDVISMYPVNNLTAAKQYAMWWSAVKNLTEIGFDTVVTMTDGNEVKAKCFKDYICNGTMQLWVDNPFAPGKRIFLMFDPTHLFKNFYNNFLKKEDFSFPSFEDECKIFRASVDHVKELYELEFGKPIKMAYKLSDQVLNPSTIEKTNVRLADSFFHESTINALQYHSKNGHEDFAETAELLEIFRKWFNAVNVKSLFGAQRTRDKGRSAIKKEDRVILTYFEKFTKWLDNWEASGGSGLSRQTFNVARQTTKVFVLLANYLLDEKRSGLSSSWTYTLRLSRVALWLVAAIVWRKLLCAYFECSSIGEDHPYTLAS